MSRALNNISRHFRLRAAVMLVMAVLLTDIPSASEAASRNTQPQFTVVLDAGHGGHDHGAIDNGVREKDINLGVAKRLAEMIKNKLKGVKVVMTRSDDNFISLQERADIANRNKGNLFISIHTNSVDKSNPNRKKVSGTSVYALGPQKDANNLKVAQRENSVIELEDNYHQKYSGFDPSKDESYIIFEMAQKKNLGQSLRFADKAQKELVKTASRNDRGVKQAGFWVLWATSMPAVLVELDFICNPTEAAYMTSEKGQEELATALFNAVKSYASTNSAKSSAMKQNTESGKKARKGNSRDEEKNVAETEEKAEDNVTAGTESGGELVSSSNTRKAQRVHKASTGSRKAYGPRKRRSSSSRQISDNRNVETQEIALRSENEYLAKQPVEEKKIVETADEDTSKAKGKNKKKNKKKDKKKQSKDKKKKSGTKEQPKKKETKKGNSKTFIVKKQGNGSESVFTRSSASASKNTSLNAAPATGGEMVYRILLLSSDVELSPSDPAFAGLKPDGMYKENNQYKYTYGGSKSRREIENSLLEVKSVLPNASIVVRME